MKLEFTQAQKEAELHKIYLEDDDVLLEGEFVADTEHPHTFILCGIATVDGERFHDVEIIFETVEEVAPSLEAIMQAEWAWYDFNFGDEDEHAHDCDCEGGCACHAEEE